MFILRGVKVLCFDTVSQVFILMELLDRFVNFIDTRGRGVSWVLGFGRLPEGLWFRRESAGMGASFGGIPRPRTCVMIAHRYVVVKLNPWNEPLGGSGGRGEH